MRMVVKSNPRQLKKIAALIVQGRVKVEIGKVFSLEDASAAHRYLLNGHVRGKVALRISTSWGNIAPRTWAP